MMSMNQMACYHVLVETYNALNFGSSVKIREKIRPASEHSNHLTVPLIRKTSCRSFTYYASRLWNILPVEIRTRAMSKESLNISAEETKRLNCFKKDIKKWIWNGGVPFR